MKMIKHKDKVITLTAFAQQTTAEERKFIDAEKKYYAVVVALKKNRESLGLTQESLAQRAKLPRTTITKIESGARNATLQTIIAMAEAMGKKVELRLH